MNNLISVHLGLILALVSFVQSCTAAPKNKAEAVTKNKYASFTEVQNSQMIHRAGTKLLDGDGNPVVLKGVNLGGWLLWEGWIFGGGFNSQSQIKNRLSMIIGKPETEQFEVDVYRNFVTEADFREIARLGFNVVRLPINHSLLEDDDRPYIYKSEGWRFLDQILDWAEKYQIYVVIDLHGAAGGQNNGFISDPEFGNSLWKSAENKKRTVSLWRAVAGRYQHRRIIAGYDLLNEPKPPVGNDLVDLYLDIIRAIRKVDRRHLVILEGGDSARDFSMFTERLDENQMYSFHMYTWFGKAHESQRLATEYTAIASRHDVPLWCGEFGEDQPAEIDRLVTLYNNEQSVSGWAFWTWKKVPNRSPALVTVMPPENWRRLMSWIAHPLLNRKPSKSETQAAMSEFLKAVRMENASLNLQMTKVLK